MALMALTDVVSPLLDMKVPVPEELERILDPMRRIAPIQAELLGLAQSIAEDGEEASPSKLSGIGTNTVEAGVYLRNGNTIGALVNISWNLRDREVRITVRALSKAQITAIWGLLALGFVLGFVAAGQIGFDDGRVGMITALVLGLIFSFCMIFPVIKLGIGTPVESVRVGERLAEAVKEWADDRIDVLPAGDAARVRALNEEPDDADEYERDEIDDQLDRELDALD